MKYISFLAVIAALLAATCQSPTSPPNHCQPPCKCVCDTTVTPPPIPSGLGDAEKFGSCSFTWTPVEKMGVFSFVNTFISADFISTDKGIFVEPIWKSRTDPDKGLDSWIKALNDKGCTPWLCINQTPSWMLPATGQASADHPPVQIGASRTDPKSYAEYARIFGELAKRYGSVKYPESDLWVNTTSRWTNDGPNQKISGLGCKFALTVWNEPDRFWHKGDGTGIYMEPEEYAAMFAACYEAVKAADPSVPCYMAGLTGTDMDYMTRFTNALKAMGKSLPDALVLHKYCHKGNAAGKHPPSWFDSGACAPELDKSFNDIKAFVTYAKSLSLHLFVTEFGTDTRPPSWMYAPPFAGKTSEQIQAEWVCRTYLEYLRLGVDKMSVFNGNDEQGAINGGLYTNSGLLYGEGEVGKIFQDKPAYAAVTALISALRGVTFTKDESTAQARIMRFDGADKTVFVYWSPTASGAEVSILVNGMNFTATEQPKYFSVSK